MRTIAGAVLMACSSILPSVLGQQADNSSQTQLIDATQRGYERLVGSLIDEGIDVNEARTDGSTPILWTSLRNDLAIVTILLQSGADPNIPDENGETALLVLFIAPFTRIDFKDLFHTLWPNLR